MIEKIILLKKWIEKYLIYIRGKNIRKKQDSSNFALIIVSGHRVGSTWIFNVLADLGIFYPAVLPVQYRQQSKGFRFINLQADGALNYLSQRSEYRIYKSHSLPPIENTTGIKYLAVFRDLRDAAVSNAYYVANLSPELGGWMEMESMTIPERIKYYLRRSEYDINLTSHWFALSDAVKVFYEQMQKDTVGTVQSVLNELGLSIPVHIVEQAIKRNSFVRMAKGRKPGQTNGQSFYRKGIIGDWKNYFDQDLIECFKTAQNGRWNSLLVKMGYERDIDW
ncbi:sulfotransferase domain-containing protein [Calditrichota bacterium]